MPLVCKSNKLSVVWNTDVDSLGFHIDQYIGNIRKDIGVIFSVFIDDIFIRSKSR